MTFDWLNQAVHWMEYIQAAGWIGWLLFIGLYAGSCLVFVPDSVLTLGAGAIYGFWGGIILVLAGNGVGAFISLLITRYLLRDWVENILPDPQKCALCKLRLKKRAGKSVEPIPKPL